MDSNENVVSTEFCHVNPQDFLKLVEIFTTFVIQVYYNLEYQPVLPVEANANQAAPPAEHGEFREGGRVVIQPYIRPDRFPLRVGNN